MKIKHIFYFPLCILFSITISNCSNSNRNGGNEAYKVDSILEKVERSKVAYAQIVKSSTPIIYDTLFKTNLITCADDGNIFEIGEEIGNWYGVIMFSGEYRYIHKSVCRIIDYTTEIPQDEQLRLQIFKALINAEDRAQNEADKKYSPKNFQENTDYNRVLNDKYKLEVFNEYKIQPPVYDAIILEGVQKKW